MAFINSCLALFCLLCIGFVQSDDVTSQNAVSSAFIPFLPEGNRAARMTLGTQVNVANCAHIGRNCYVQRDKAENPTKVDLGPCCEHLTCQGFGPTDIKNGFGQAVGSSEKYFTGICTVSLDSNGGNLQEYIDYVKGL